MEAGSSLTSFTPYISCTTLGMLLNLFEPNLSVLISNMELVHLTSEGIERVQWR